MKQSELLFKFPYRMTSQSDWDKYNKKYIQALESDSSEEIELPEYAIGYELVAIEEIIGMSTSFSRGTSIRKIQNTGGDCCIVNLKNGKELTCDMPLKELVDAYDAHYEMLQNATSQRVREQAEKNALIYREVLEDKLSDIKEKYKEENIELDINDL